MHVGGCPGGISILVPPGICNGGDTAKNGYGNTDRSYGIFSIAAGQGGGFYGYIGTSLSSPQFAGVMALLVEQKGRQGNVNQFLYKVAAKQASEGTVGKYLHTGIPGYNGVRESNVSPTYNVSTGIGTPVVKELIEAPAGTTAAGTPRTPSNP
jgi:subtilase family serine protease